MTNQTIPSSRRLEGEPPAGEEAGNTVRLNKWGETPDEVDDETKHAFAEGTLTIRTVADNLSAIALEGNPISREDLDRIHHQLLKIFDLLRDETVFRLRDDQPDTDAEVEALWAYCDTYSDGTPVATMVGPLDCKGWSAPGEFYDRRIPWLPKMTGTFGFLPAGPRPPGYEVLLARPPAKRPSGTKSAEEYEDFSFSVLNHFLRVTKERIAQGRKQ